MTNHVNFVILTALEEERDAVLLFLENVTKEEKYGRTDYVCSSAKYNGDVVLVCINNMGRVPATMTVTQVINEWQPDYIIITGIAGGIEKKGVKCGDLIIAESIYDLASGKKVNKTVENRPQVYRVDNALLNSFKDFKEKNELLLTDFSNLSCCVNDFTPIIYNKDVACTDYVIADQITVDSLLKVNANFYCCEMEGAGLAYAAHRLSNKNNKPGVFFIKGISDLCINKDNTDKKWRKYARNIAAFYTVNFINYLHDTNFFPPVESEHRHKGWWLIEDTDLWNDYLYVLYFAKQVHNMYQSIFVGTLKEVNTQIKSYLGAKGKNHKADFNVSWTSYENNFDELQSKFFSDLGKDDTNDLITHIVGILEKIKSSHKLQLLNKIKKLNSNLDDIKSNLDGYQTIHDSIKKSMDTSIDNTMPDISEKISKLTTNTSRLINTSDTLIKILVDILLLN